MNTESELLNEFKIDHLIKAIDEIKGTLKEVFDRQHEQWKLFFDREDKVKSELDSRVAANKSEMEKRMDDKINGVYRWLVGISGAVVVAGLLIVLGFRH